MLIFAGFAVAAVAGYELFAQPASAAPSVGGEPPVANAVLGTRALVGPPVQAAGLPPGAAAVPPPPTGAVSRVISPLSPVRTLAVAVGVEIGGSPANVAPPAARAALVQLLAPVTTTVLARPSAVPPPIIVGTGSVQPARVAAAGSGSAGGGHRLIDVASAGRSRSAPQAGTRLPAGPSPVPWPAVPSPSTAGAQAQTSGGAHRQGPDGRATAASADPILVSGTAVAGRHAFASPAAARPAVRPD